MAANFDPSATSGSDSDVPLACLLGARSQARSGGVPRKYQGLHVEPGKIQVRLSHRGVRWTVGEFKDLPTAARAYDYIKRCLPGTRRESLNFPAQVDLPEQEKRYAQTCVNIITGEHTFIGVANRFNTHTARIYINKKKYELGTFSSAAEAGCAYDFAVRELNLHRKTNYPLDATLHLSDDAKARVREALAASRDGRAGTAVVSPVSAGSRELSFEAASAEFISVSNAGPLYVCTSCRRTWFQRSVQRVSAGLRARAGVQNCTQWFSGRRSVDDVEWICSTCYRYAVKGRCPPCAPCKQPDLPVLDPALQGLTSMENDLIALRLPFMKMIGLPPCASGGPRKLGQYALKGMVANVPADINRVQLALPRTLEGEGTVPVCIKYKLKYKSCYKAAENIEPLKLKAALQSLVTRDTLWREAGVSIREDWEIADTSMDIVSDPSTLLPSVAPLLSDELSAEKMDESLLSDAPGEEDADAPDRLPDEETFFDDSFSLPDKTRAICVAPSDGHVPIGMLQDPLAEEKAFPALFNGFARPQTSLTYSQLVRFELTNENRRFAMFPSNIFYKLRKLQTLLVSKLSWVRLRKSKLEGHAPLQAGDLREPSKRATLLSRNIGFRDFKQLRGSPDYEQEGKREAFATIRQLGPFQFFCTFTMAETHWSELLQTLRFLATGSRISAEEACALPWREVVMLIRNDPVTVARCYCNRRDALINAILKCPSILGRVTDFFWRDEFQQRGSPHTHAAFYIADAPRFDVCADSAIVNFIDQYVTCSLSAATENNIRGQRHSHSEFYCLRRSGKKGSKMCRFRFPRPPLHKTMLLRPLPDDIPDAQRALAVSTYRKVVRVLEHTKAAALDSMSIVEYYDALGVSEDEYILALRASVRKPTVFLRRSPAERNINPFNAKILSLTNTNMDCQFALDVYAAASYISSYMMKTDYKLSKIMEAAYKEARHGNADLQKAIRQVGGTFLKAQEVCAQQAVYGCLGLPFRRNSREHIFIPSGRPSDRTFLIKQDSVLQCLDPSSTDCIASSIIDRYASRLLNVSLAHTRDLCLAQFAAWYERGAVFPPVEEEVNDDGVDCEPMVIASASSSCTPTAISRSDSRSYYKRKKAKIIHYVHAKKADNPEAYFREQLLLFYPWSVSTADPIIIASREDDALLCGEINFEARFYQVENIIMRNYAEFDANMGVDWNAVQQEAEMAAEMDHAHLEALFEGDGRKKADKDGTESEDELMESELPSEFRQNPDFESCTNSLGSESIPMVQYVIPEDEFRADMRKLTQRQRAYVDHVLYRLQFPTSEMFVEFLTGGAGTGKSLVLRCISQLVIRSVQTPLHADLTAVKVLLVAFTGSAAYNINGSTLHSTFKIPLCSLLEGYTQLSAEKKCELRDALAFLQLLVIDEISFVGGRFLQFVSNRMKDIFDDEREFGNIPTIVCGDLYQLKPLFDCWCFQGVPREGVILTNIWEDYVRVYELFEIKRQAGDMEFAEALNRLRVGAQTPADIALFETRVISPFALPDEYSVFLRHMFPTRAKRDSHNELVYTATDGTGLMLQAYDTVLSTSITARVRQSYLRKAARMDDTDTATLFYKLHIKVGIIVEITCNIDVPDGLFNGAWGRLCYIQQSDGFAPHLLWVHMSKPAIGARARETNRLLYANFPDINRAWTPIFRVSKRFQLSKRVDSEILRTQFPIRPATGTTIHHNQGLTLHTGAVDFRGASRANVEPGRHYVGLSRFTRLENVFILDGAFDEILIDTRVHAEMRRLHQQSPVSLLIPEIQPSKALTGVLNVIAHNSRSLPCHFADVFEDHAFQNADILLLSETRIPVAAPSGELESSVFGACRAPVADSGQAGCFENVCAFRRRARHDVALQLVDCRSANNTQIASYLMLLSGKPSCIFVLLYRSPSGPEFSTFLNMLNDVLLRFPKGRLDVPEVVCCGDFNVDMCKTNSTTAKLLSLMRDKHDFQLLTAHPTTTYGSCLDHIWIRSASLVSTWHSLRSYWSDHLPIRAKLCFSVASS